MHPALPTHVAYSVPKASIQAYRVPRSGCKRISGASQNSQQQPDRGALHLQVASALHNAENGWGPVNASFLKGNGAPAPAPAQAAAAVPAETAPR